MLGFLYICTFFLPYKHHIKASINSLTYVYQCFACKHVYQEVNKESCQTTTKSISFLYLSMS
jgi:hypothetical protein